MKRAPLSIYSFLAGALVLVLVGAGVNDVFRFPNWTLSSPGGGQAVMFHNASTLTNGNPTAGAAGNSADVQFNQGGSLAGTNDIKWHRTNRFLHVNGSVHGVTNITTNSGGLLVRGGAGPVYVRAGGTLTNQMSGGVNTVGGNTDFHTPVLYAHTLTNFGDGVDFVWSGGLGNGVKIVSVIYGSETVLTALTTNAGIPFRVTGTIVRKDSASQFASFAAHFTQTGATGTNIVTSDVVTAQTNGIDTTIILRGNTEAADRMTSTWYRVVFVSQ